MIKEILLKKDKVKELQINTSRKEYIQFLNIAYGSAAELETQISLAYDLKMLNEDSYRRVIGLSEEVSKLLFSLIRALKQK